MDVIIFSGQSNMCGETDCFPSENQPVTGAYEYINPYVSGHYNNQALAHIFIQEETI